MKNKWIWIMLVAIVVLLIVAGMGIRHWLESLGVRVVGDTLYVNVQYNGYIFDGETGEMIAQSPVIMKGATSETDADVFDGDLEVTVFRNTPSGTISRTAGLEKTASGIYTIRVLETCTHQETDDENVTKEVEHILDYTYLYCIDPENPEDLTVVVEDLEESTAYYVVCADTEEQARENYKAFLENKPK